MAITKAPDHTGISVKIVDLKLGKLPEAPYTEAIAIGHMDDFQAIIGGTRPVKKYTPINDRDYEQIVSTGAIEYSEFSATVLFDFNSDEGANKLHKAFKDNTEIGLIIQLKDKLDETGKDTLIAQIIRVSEFSIGGEKDGKMNVQIRAEKIGNPVITPATKGI